MGMDLFPVLPYMLMSERVLLSRVYSVVDVLPTYCFLHSVHVIKYISHDDLQCSLVCILYVFFVMVLVNESPSFMNLQVMHFLAGHL